MNKYIWKLNTDKFYAWALENNGTAAPLIVAEDVEISITAENQVDATKSLGAFIDRTFLDLQEDI